MNVSITATELTQNLEKYLLLSFSEDVYITRNGKVMKVLVDTILPHKFLKMISHK